MVAVTSSIAMDTDTFQLDDGFLAKEWDVAIAGAGVVGLFLAVLLSRSGLSVAVIEGGGKVADTSQNAANTELVGRRHSSVESGRAMGLGGTSLLWGGQLAELCRADLTAQDQWPVTYEQLTALYARTYAALGLPPRPANAEARATFGSDEGVLDDIERMFSYWLPNPNLASLFRAELAEPQRIGLVTNAKVVGFLFAENGDTRSLILGDAAHQRLLRAKSYVIAAGVVESSRLLLSATRSANCPWAENRNIGRYFQDHLGGEIGQLRVHDDRRFRECFETGFVNGVKLMPKLLFHPKQAIAGESSGSVSAFPSYYSRMSEHLTNIKALLKAVRTGTAYAQWNELPRSLWSVGKAFAPLVYRYAVEKRVMAFFDGGVRLSVQCHQSVCAQSDITLDYDSIQADGLPRVALNWRLNSGDGALLVRAATAFKGYFERTQMADLIIDEQLLAEPETFFANLRDTSHPSGGLRMSRDPSDGATNFDGCVSGSNNTYVAGASVMPDSGEANVTLTALALATRLSDHLVALHRKSPSFREVVST